MSGEVRDTQAMNLSFGRRGKFCLWVLLAVLLVPASALCKPAQTYQGCPSGMPVQDFYVGVSGDVINSGRTKEGPVCVRVHYNRLRFNLSLNFVTTQGKGVDLSSVLLTGSLPAAAPGGAVESRGATIEGYPPDVLAALEIRDRARRNAPREVAGYSLQYVFTVANKWTGLNGQPPKITVAFRGGDDTLRREIAEAAAEWSKYGHFQFDFNDPSTGGFREWTTSDTSYQADIRISFDQAGYWSLVGTDSIDGIVRKPSQPSMNFGQFTQQLPADWRTIVQHEFGHALGLQHEHQAPVGGCDADWKWDDDPGYTPTTDAYGWYGPDLNGKWPGIYTYLGGYANFWPRAIVDQNLRQLNNDTHAYDQGPFDKNSIMKYYFPPFMFVLKEQSHCYSEENLVISANDQVGIEKWYPAPGQGLVSMQNIQRTILSRLVELKEIEPLAKQSLQMQLNKLAVH